MLSRLRSFVGCFSTYNSDEEFSALFSFKGLLVSLSKSRPNLSWVVLHSSASEASAITDFSLDSRLFSLFVPPAACDLFYSFASSLSFLLNIVFITRFKWKSISCWFADRSSYLALALISYRRVILRISSSLSKSSLLSSSLLFSVRSVRSVFRVNMLVGLNSLTRPILLCWAEELFLPDSIDIYFKLFRLDILTCADSLALFANFRVSLDPSPLYFRVSPDKSLRYFSLWALACLLLFLRASMRWATEDWPPTPPWFAYEFTSPLIMFMLELLWSTSLLLSHLLRPRGCFSMVLRLALPSSF